MSIVNVFLSKASKEKGKFNVKGCRIMKRFFVLCAVLWAAVFIIPLIAISKRAGEIPVLPLPSEGIGTSEKTDDSEIEVTLSTNGKTETLSLSEYLEGVVAAEMPALFPEEALKAQAVAARTYTMKKMTSPPAEGHNGAYLCDNPAHCKAYKPISSFAAAWDDEKEEYTEKIKRAVSETDGEILLYDGSPISAVFHSTSSGMTENAKDVWGGDAPYLVSVKSEGEEESPHYQEERELAPEEFKSIFVAKYPNASFDENPENWVTDISRSAAGGIKSLSVGKVSIKGSDVRTLFGLNSTNFTLIYENGKMKFRTRGYGHGVGMSQYGARAMALSGKKYEEILKSYYTGVELGKINQKSSS